MGRTPCCDKANVKKGSWAPEEDAKLKDYIEKYGTGGNWITLPQKIGIKRCGKSCRLRWLNYLRPNIKHGNFSEEEEDIICSLYISVGSRWSVIAAQLPGRTDNDIKNYWNTRLKKKLIQRHKQAYANSLSSSSLQDMKDDINAMGKLKNPDIQKHQIHMPLDENSDTSNHDNSEMWPCKLNSVQEKMRCSLEYFLDSSNHLMMKNVWLDDPQNFELHELKSNTLQQEYYPPSSISFNMMDSSINGINTLGSSINVWEQYPNMESQQYWAFQAESDDLSTIKGDSFNQAQTSNSDYFDNMDTIRIQRI